MSLSASKVCKKGLHEYSIELRTCPECKSKAQFQRSQTSHAKQTKRKYYEANKDKARGHNYRQFWPNLTAEQALQEYDRILAVQNYCCAICNIHQSKLSLRLAVDHDHKTSLVRGLLCIDCNTGIGKLKESEEILASAARYLGLKHVTVPLQPAPVVPSPTVNAPKREPVPELKAEEIVAPMSVLDELDEDEIMYWSTPYYDEIQAKKQAMKEAKESGTNEIPNS